MELKPGAVAVLHRTFNQRDFDRFAALSNDDNPIHVDPEFAGRTRFGRTVCHGMLLYSTICRALTDALGSGFAQYEQELMFVTPTYTDEEVAVRLEVTALYPDPNLAVTLSGSDIQSAFRRKMSSEGSLAEISTVITRPDGSVACQGQTRVALPGEVPASAGSVPTRTQPPEGSIPESVAATTLKWLALGQTAEITRTFSEADLQEYRDLSGDTNPTFSDAAYAREHGWPAPQVPGGLLGGLFSFLLGTRLPGRGTNWLKQRLAFPAPCYARQEITARVEIVRLRPEKDLVNLRTICMTTDGQRVCEGEALVLVKDLEHA
jgi:acyl dehydratase